MRRGRAEALQRGRAGGPAARPRITPPALLGITLIANLSGGAAYAQTAPNAGDILRDIQRATPPLVKPPAPTAPVAPPEEAPPLKEGQRVLVKDFRIRATIFPEAVLKQQVKDFIGRDCTLGDLEEAAARIGRYYREHDYLARAYLPRQTIHDGIVEIVVLEGRLGAVSVDPASRSRLHPDIAVGRVLYRQPADTPIRPSALQAGVASVNSLPGVDAAATLVPGKAAGQSDVVLRLVDTPLLSGSLQADNFSPRSVGSWRGVGMAALNDALGLGDLEQLALLRSNGSEYGRVGATLPAGPSGLTLGVSASYLDFAVDKEFNASGATGSAFTAGASASHPLLRGEAVTLDAALAYDHKRLITQTAYVTTGDSRIDIGTLGVSGSLRDSLLAGGITTFGAGFGFGHLDLSGDRDNQALDQATARSAGTYAKLTATLGRLQRVVARTELVLALSGQWASKNLDSAEKFSLGGPGGVRAYPINEANGDEGWLATAELRYTLLEGLRLGPFLDAGAITQHVEPWSGWQGGGNQPNSYRLFATGLAASWVPVPAVALRATVAHALGTNPGAAPGGYAADGRRDKTRFWLQASVTF